MSDESEGEACCCFCSSLILILIPVIVLSCLYTNPNQPELSIVDFSVPALNKTSNETIGDVYFDLKLRNMNKAISLYYVDPSNIAISYYPLEDPYQKYVWEYALPPFFQGDGKTNHIRTLVGQPSSKVVHKEDNTTGKVVSSFRIGLVVSYKFNHWENGVNKIEAVAEVAIDANTGGRVSKDKINLEIVTSEVEWGQLWVFQLLG